MCTAGRGNWPGSVPAELLSEYIEHHVLLLSKCSLSLKFVKEGANLKWLNLALFCPFGFPSASVDKGNLCLHEPWQASPERTGSSFKPQCALAGLKEGVQVTFILAPPSAILCQRENAMKTTRVDRASWKSSVVFIDTCGDQFGFNLYGSGHHLTRLLSSDKTFCLCICKTSALTNGQPYVLIKSVDT